MSETDERRDPFDRPKSDEPAEAYTTETPDVLARRGRGRRGPVRPSEKRRRARRVGVTFSDPDIPERLRAVAERWEMYAPDGKSPNVSAVIEHLLLPRLEAAEKGKVKPPRGRK